MTGGILAVFAHPDDESLLAGGTLAACAARRLRVAIVSLTRGEEGGSAVDREAELRKAGDALGAASAECLGYPDGELDDCDPERVVAELAELIERERPAAMIGFSAEGLYWHPDHITAAERLAAARELLGDAAPAWAYGATWPEGHASGLVAAARARGLPTDLWGLEPEAFGAPPESITTTIDVRATLTAKLRALRSHHSQITPGHLLHALPGDLAEEFLGREYFVLLDSPEPSRDWLADTLAGRR